MSLRDVHEALAANGLKATGAERWEARCPAHEDRKASLSVGLGSEGRVLLKCHAGCATEDVVKALQLAPGALFEASEGERPKARVVASYGYRDEAGTLLYEVCRFEPKDFRQRKPAPGGGYEWKLGDVRRVLYRLPELIASKRTEPVFVVEGEKDADRLAAMGLVATTNVGGAGPGKWKDEYTKALRGRSVVVIPDNDQPGDEHAAAVAKALEGQAAAVHVLRLPGLPAKGDVSDWIVAGGTAAKLRAMVEPHLAKAAVFAKAAERLEGERAERIEMGSRVLTFGIDYLDHALGGIVPRDVVLIGAKTGIGKTALATNLAMANCQNNYRVHMFALEAEEREIERRMKFQLLSDCYFADPNRNRSPIRYLDWYMGKLDHVLGYYEDVVDTKLRLVLRNLSTYYRIDSFTSDDFRRQLDEVKDETDLIILDHLHYVDSDDENENRGYKRTVKQIRDAAIRIGKPIIVVAHVRKSDRRNEPLIPTIEDFHGSSDIPKIATKAVMLAPAFDVPNPKPYLWHTYIQASKCRLDSSATRYAALVMFNARRNAYEKKYSIGQLTDGGKTFRHLPDEEHPSWARAQSPTQAKGPRIHAGSSYYDPKDTEE